MNLGDVRVGLYNFVIIGIMALLFIVAMKMVTSRFPIPGVTEVVHAA
jgi:hypothetical protein